VKRPRIEALEARCLLSVTFNEFPVPTSGSIPDGIVAGPDGNLWFTELGGNNIGQINPTIHAIAEFPIPTAGSAPDHIVAGPDGNLWFTEFTGNKIGQINPATHAITEFPIPTAHSDPFGITTGPDGNLWFTEDAGNNIGRINPTTHAITEFPIPTANGSPRGITVGPDGNLWFLEWATSDQIGVINTTTHAIAEFPLPTAFSSPFEIAAGPDGNLWFTEYGFAGNSIGQINPTTHAIAEFPLPTAKSEPEGIAVGPDGNLWFTEQAGNNIGQINPTTHAIAEFPIPTAQSFPDVIAAGPDGNLWFTEATGNKIGEVVLKPLVTAPDLALSSNAPTSVTLGGNVTYTLTVTNNGTAGATGVALTDTLPAGVSFISASGGVTPVSGVLTFSIGSLAAGASDSFTIVVTPTASGSLTNTAVASMSQTDTTPADNSVTLTTAVSSPTASAPDLALTGTGPASVTLGSNVTYTLTATNDGTAVATSVKVTDTLPAGVTFVSASGGVTPASGVVTFNVGSLAAGANAGFTIVVTPTAAGTLSNRASVSGTQTDPSPADNSVTLTTTVNPSVQRHGFHSQSTTLVLSFGTPLDTSRAQNPANYRLVTLGGSERTIRVKRAVYNPATRTVTLSPAHRLNLHNLFRLTVIETGSSGVTDISGNLLGDPKAGDPGSNFVTIVSASDLVLTTTDPAILRAYKKIVSSQAPHLGAAGPDRSTALPGLSPNRLQHLHHRSASAVDAVLAAGGPLLGDDQLGRRHGEHAFDNRDFPGR